MADKHPDICPIHTRVLVPFRGLICQFLLPHLLDISKRIALIIDSSNLGILSTMTGFHCHRRKPFSRSQNVQSETTPAIQPNQFHKIGPETRDVARNVALGKIKVPGSVFKLILSSYGKKSGVGSNSVHGNPTLFPCRLPILKRGASMTQPPCPQLSMPSQDQSSPHMQSNSKKMLSEESDPCPRKRRRCSDDNTDVDAKSPEVMCSILFDMYGRISGCSNPVICEF